MSSSSVAHSRRASRRCCACQPPRALLRFPHRVPGNRRTSPLPARPPPRFGVRARDPRGRQTRRRRRRSGLRYGHPRHAGVSGGRRACLRDRVRRHRWRGAADRQSQRVRADHHQRPRQLSIGDHSGAGRRRRLRSDRRLWTRGGHPRAGERGASAFPSARRHVRATRARARRRRR